jgi:hypothetical protein
MTITAKERLKKNWISIVLTFVSIIQGLAFNNLVIRFPAIYVHEVSTHSYLLLAHFLICFMILMRVTQTYIAAALDYSDWNADIVYIFGIFALGAVEYFIFSTLNVDNFEIKTFHTRLFLITILATVSYSTTLRGIIKEYSSIQNQSQNICFTEEEYNREKKLQYANIFGVLIPSIISAWIVVGPTYSKTVYIAFCVIISTILALNIYNSLKVTFTESAQVTPTESAQVTPTESTQVTPTESTQVTPTESTQVTPTESTQVTPTESTQVTPTESSQLHLLK